MMRAREVLTVLRPRSHGFSNHPAVTVLGGGRRASLTPDAPGPDITHTPEWSPPEGQRLRHSTPSPHHRAPPPSRGQRRRGMRAKLAVTRPGRGGFSCPAPAGRPPPGGSAGG